MAKAEAMFPTRSQGRRPAAGAITSAGGAPSTMGVLAPIVGVCCLVGCTCAYVWCVDFVQLLDRFAQKCAELCAVDGASSSE
jgi:hypothetical protein